MNLEQKIISQPIEIRENLRSLRARLFRINQHTETLKARCAMVDCMLPSSITSSGVAKCRLTSYVQVSSRVLNEIPLSQVGSTQRRLMNLPHVARLACRGAWSAWLHTRHQGPGRHILSTLLRPLLIITSRNWVRLQLHKKIAWVLLLAARQV